jgi:hypothetical protein
MARRLHTRKLETHKLQNVKPIESSLLYMSCIRTLNLRMRCDHMNTHTQIHDETIERHETRKHSGMYVTKQHDNVENAFITDNDRRAML